MALVQSTNKSAGAVTSTTLAFTSAVTAGNAKLVFIFGGGSGNTESASDNLDGAYAQDVILFSNNITGSINSKKNATAGSTTVTASQSINAQLKIIIAERDDIDPLSTVDQTSSSANSNSTNFTTGTTAALAQNNETLVAMCCFAAGGSTVTAGSGYTLDPSSGISNKLYVEYGATTTGGTQTAGFAISGTPATESGPALLATYRVPGSGAATLSAATGTFTLTGEAATLTSSTGAFSLPLATGTFSFTGESVTLTATGNFLLVAQPGAFDLLGGLSTSDYTMDATADVNSQFTLFGPPVTLTGPAGTQFALSVSSGLFALTGFTTNLSLSQQFTLISDTGLFTLSGEILNGTLAGGICNTIPQPGIVIVLEIITEAYQKIGVVSELEFPTAEQGANGLRILNDYLLNQAADGMRLGWFKQTDLSAVAPLRSEDVWGVKLLLARQLASHYGISLSDPVLLANINDAERMLTKRSLQYFESDLSELSRPEGGPWGGPGQWW